MPKQRKREDRPAEQAAKPGGAEGAQAPEQQENDEAQVIFEPAAQRMQQLQERLAEAEQRAQELNEKYLRALADLENFRRRARRERTHAMRDGESAILLEVLPLLDNFARAMTAARDSNNAQALMEGVKMSYDQLHAALARKGVHPIAAEGKPFDPLYHDAVGRLETTEQPEGTVAVEIQKGYMLGERVLRPSRVMVAVCPPAPSHDEESDSEEGCARNDEEP